MTTKHKVSLEIVTGGSREDVRDSAGCKRDQLITMQLHIKLEDEKFMKLGIGILDEKEPLIFTVQLHGYMWEDGSREMAIIYGYVKKIEGNFKGKLDRSNFRGFYKTQNRTGYLHFEWETIKD